MNQVSQLQEVETPARGISERATMAVPRTRRLTKRAAIALVVLAGTTAAGKLGHDYWTVGRFRVSTDDAYVEADYTAVAPKVSGYIADVMVHDNEPVKTGQVLARIDDRDFRVALDQAQANVAAADASVQNLDAQISLQQAEIAQAAASLLAAQATLGFADADAKRYHELAGTGFGTVQRAEQTKALRDQASAQLHRDEAAVMAAQRKIAVLATARAEATAQADHARATERQAKLNLGYTTITAAMDGTVGARTLRVGEYVAAGTELMAIVPLHAAYVVANFKETQLARVRPGQAVRIAVDGRPDMKVRGHVDSLAPASGLEFALLPPDNATGNFTKIVQRIPVRIVFDDEAQARQLRAGMSVEPTINTKQSTGTEPRVLTASTSGLTE